MRFLPGDLVNAVSRRLSSSALAPAWYRLNAQAFSMSQPRRLVLASDARHYTAHQKFAPILRHAPLLARRFGIVIETMSLEDLSAAGPGALDGAAALGLMLDFDASAHDIGVLLEDVVAPIRARGVKIILFDGDDDLGVLWGDALAAADICVKKHAFRDRAAYGRETIGKSNLTDHVARTYGQSYEGDIIQRSGGLPAADAAKIRVGWNIALDDKIVALSRRLPRPDHDRKDIDILCRASVAETVWTFPMRDAAVQNAETLADDFRVHAPTDRVSQAAYTGELQRSRISLSPFGYGEICWRDFESILAGALLVKPSMEHVETAPDLFVPGETYVPVAWDYSDLAEVAARYLDDEPLRRRIAEQARERLLAALSREWFVERFEETVVRPLLRAGSGVSSVPRPPAPAANGVSTCRDCAEPSTQ